MQIVVSTVLLTTEASFRSEYKFGTELLYNIMITYKKTSRLVSLSLSCLSNEKEEGMHPQHYRVYENKRKKTNSFFLSIRMMLLRLPRAHTISCLVFLQKLKTSDSVFKEEERTSNFCVSCSTSAYIFMYKK